MTYFTYSHIPNLLLDCFLLFLGWTVLAFFGAESHQLYWTILILALVHIGISSFAVHQFNKRVQADLNQGEFEKKRLPVHKNKEFYSGILVFTNERCLLYKDGWFLEWWENMADLKAIKIEEPENLFASKKILLEFEANCQVFHAKFWVNVKRLNAMENGEGSGQ